MTPGQTPSPQLRLFLIPIISPRSSILQHPRLQRPQSLSLHLILIHLTVPNITALPHGSRYVNQYNNLNYAPQALYSHTNHLYQILPKYKKTTIKTFPFPSLFLATQLSIFTDLSQLDFFNSSQYLISFFP